MLKSGLRILIRAREVPFWYPQNSQKHPFWAFLGAPKMALVLKSGLRILIRAPQVPFWYPPKRPVSGPHIAQRVKKYPYMLRYTERIRLM